MCLVLLESSHPFGSFHVEEVMYETAAIAEKSSGHFTIALTLSLLGLALSLFVIGTAGLVDPEAMAKLFLSF